MTGVAIGSKRPKSLPGWFVRRICTAERNWMICWHTKRHRMNLRSTVIALKPPLNWARGMATKDALAARALAF